MPPKKKKAAGTTPAPRGRPKIKFVIKGRQKLKEGLAKLLGPRSPILDPAQPGPESASGGVKLTGDAARLAALADEDYGVQTERQETETSPVWLQHVDREAKGWVLLDTINTEDVPKWFEDQVRTFHALSWTYTESVLWL